MTTNQALIRSLRERAPSEGLASADSPEASGLLVAVEVLAVNAGAIPATHDLAMLGRTGEQLDGPAISGAIMPGGGAAAVGAKMVAVLIASGDWLLLAGGGGSSGASGGILPHSHMGGGDGPVIAMTGTV